MYGAIKAIEVNAAFKKEAKQARDTQTCIYFQYCANAHYSAHQS